MNITFPPEFDPGFYRSSYPDLGHLGFTALAAHFEHFGRREGRLASPAAVRQNFLSLIPEECHAVEIGPFFRPVVTGPHVKYFDVLDTEALRSRALALGENASTVPQIHFSSTSGDLGVINEIFDVVVSSHVIEHQPDLISHLQQVRRILRDDGFYFLIVPDKRYCYDHFLAEATIADVLDAYFERRRVHRLSSVIEHRALTTHNDPVRHWQNDNGPQLNGIDRVADALQEYNSRPGEYIDVHAWQFTPRSFKQVFLALHSLTYIDLYPIRTYDTLFGSLEFYAILSPRCDL